MKDLPRVSCVCVSQNRPHFLKKAISYFKHQTYPNKDLVIVYEGDEPGKSVVAAVDAKAMLSVVGNNPALDAVATEVNEKLTRVVAQL